MDRDREKPAKAVVFDMDGVLFDTERICRDSWLETARKRGLPGMDEIFPRCIGLNSNGSRKIVTQAYGGDFDYDDFRREASDWFWDYIDKNGVPIMPGAEALLLWLKENGWILGLASSTRQASVASCLERSGLDRFFPVVVTGDMVEYSKPRPDIYLLACSRLGIEPGEAYAVEDSPNGIRAASAAGMLPLMVPDMIPPDQEMRELSFRIFENLNQVLLYLKEKAE